MSRIKPISLELKFGLIVGLLLLIVAAVGIIPKWDDSYKFFAPNGNLLNWRFTILLLIITNLITWFVMNFFWVKEVKFNTKLESEKELNKEDYELSLKNLRELLKSSEIEYLSDPITGIPNVKRLEKDFENFFLSDDKPLLQFVFIDLKNFSDINKTFLSQKTNKLIRHIAQDIYLGMRRNESMFKFLAAVSTEKKIEGNFYRIFPGGDEFVFIIQGDQSEGLGFINRLNSKFIDLSESTEKILGHKRKLSFYCSIVQVEPKDRSFEDIFERAEICYRTVWSTATADFAITWYPNYFEKSLSKDPRKQEIYKRSKEIFEYIPIIENS